MKIGFTEKANKIHNYRYDYSLATYVNAITKIKIICLLHGVFDQSPNSHLSGRGCPTCAVQLRSSDKEKFIKKASEVHGDRYDYSQVSYKNNKTKVTIICRQHGKFEQKPDMHLTGQGCKRCKAERLSGLYKSNTDEFIQKSQKIHRDRYIYSQVKYEDSWTDVTIICSYHGTFKQKPFTHLQGAGCPRCSESSGEKAVAFILDKHGIRYKREFKLPNYNFRYDFYLPDHNLLVEFHGRQHFEAIGFFGGKEGFRKTRERDLFKKALAKEYKTPLIFFSHRHLDTSRDAFEQLILSTIRKYHNASL